jgi:hypothetical protein
MARFRDILKFVVAILREIETSQEISGERVADPISVTFERA